MNLLNFCTLTAAVEKDLRKNLVIIFSKIFLFSFVIILKCSLFLFLGKKIKNKFLLHFLFNVLRKKGGGEYKLKIKKYIIGRIRMR